jgi:hypothetical protein
MIVMVNKIFIRTVIVTTIALTFTPASNADVIKVTDAATLQQQQGAKYFSQRGISGEKAEVLETAGADRSLALAMKMLIPDDWFIQPSGNYEQAVVSWKGGVSWPLIIRNIAENEGIYVSLDWILKTVTINVPGQTQSESELAQKGSTTLTEGRQAFRKKQRDSWSKRSDIERELSTERNQLASIMEKQRASQIANQEFIANLNDSNDELSRQKTTLEQALEAEREKREEIERKYAVIDPVLGPKTEVDATQLFTEYEKSWVLPFDKSFEYFIKGGHSDLIETHTPATYIAKSGSVRHVLEMWADAVGWEIDYIAEVNHKNPFEVEFQGSFVESSRELVSIFELSDRPIDIQFYPDVKIERKDGTVRKGLAVVSDLNYKK